MKSNFTCCVFIFCATFLGAQNLIDFEAFNLPSESYLNGEDESGGFSSGAVFLPNNYNPQYMSWTGWSISNTTDVTTPGLTNQYSAFPGSGFNGSKHYAVSYSLGNNIMRLEGDALEKPVSGMYITNNTYAYLSMQDGDSFAKKFGGVTGNDPDFFLLTIKGYSNGVLTDNRVEFYLADFRFSDNSKDYIVDEWTFVDLTSLGMVDSLSFILTSSDSGQFGMNTPAYFCVDQIFATELVSSTASINDPDLFEIFPNPTTDRIQLKHLKNEILDCSVFHIDGRLVLQQTLGAGGGQIDLQALPSGHYMVKVQGDKVYSTQIVIKE